MSSGRSPASAMDADATEKESAPRSPASPSRSKKRPSRTGDGQSSPNPSPGGGSSAGKTDPKRRRLRTSAESAALALASVAADADRAVAKRRGVRVDDGHGGIQMLGAAAARVDRGHHAAGAQKPGGPAAAEGPVTRRRAAGKQPVTARGGAAHKLWSDADEFTLLNAALEYRKRTGRVPRLPDMAEFFDDITDLISPEIDQWMVYYKLKRLKSKFQHTDGPSDRRLRALCADLWGEFPSLDDVSDGDTDAGDRRAVPDAAAMMPVVTEVLGEYWNTNSRAMGGVPLEKGLSRLGKKQGRVLEIKWRQQLDEEMQTQMKRHDLAKEVCSLLSGAIKGLGP